MIFETYPEVGYNYRMTDLQAAIGRQQLKRLPSIIARRRELAVRYRSRFDGCTSVSPPIEPAWAKSNWQSFSVRLADGLPQQAVMQSLLDAGISCKRGIMCSHREAPYAAHAADNLTRSEQAQDRSVLLPLFPAMLDSELDHCANTLLESCQQQLTR